MKVLIVCDTMRVGGTERLTVSLANELMHRGYECAIYVIWCKRLESLGLLDKRVKTYYGGRRHKFDFSYIRRLRGAMNQFRPDVILCEANFSYLSTRFAMWSKPRKPVFLAIHYTYSFALKSRIFDKILFFMLRHFGDRLISIYNDQVKHFSQKHVIETGNVTVIHNGVDVGFYDKDAFAGRQAKVRNAHLNIVHVANHRKEKDQWTLLKSLALFNRRYGDWHLTFCGSIPQREKNRYTSFASENHIVDKITFMNRVGDVRHVLSRAHVFVLSSISEALPLSVLEAMAMGVPCILTEVGGCKDIIVNSQNGFLVPANDPTALSEKLLFFAHHPDELRRMAREARKTAVERFSLATMAGKYSSLFENTAG